MRENAMRGSFLTITLEDGEARTLSMVGAPVPATIWVKPISGDTVSVKISFDGVNFIDWELGDVTDTSSDVLASGILSIRFQRVAGTGTTSTCGVC